jgi:hypothetical protein
MNGLPEPVPNFGYGEAEVPKSFRPKWKEILALAESGGDWKLNDVIKRAEEITNIKDIYGNILMLLSVYNLKRY